MGKGVEERYESYEVVLLELFVLLGVFDWDTDADIGIKVRGILSVLFKLSRLA